MKTDDNRDKLRLIKEFFIFNMLQQPSCFININKRTKIAKTSTTNIKQTIIESDSESMIPICDKSTMAKFLVTLRLLQGPHYNKDKATTNNYCESSIPTSPIIIDAEIITDIPIE